ncbi:MAG: DUF6273 domain-containing protein [Oscillospiraceae bacterium]|nr:DUF6273 domain-containing protein [Oscillospiraceae bacterium]
MRKLLTAALAVVMLSLLLAGCAGNRSQDIEMSNENDNNVNVQDIVVVEDINAAAIGDVVYFGDDLWRVLNIQDGNALIITEHLIEMRFYHQQLEDITWEHSDIRQWLNSTFLDKFSQTDRNRIVQTTVVNRNNQWHDTPGGNDTQDYVFLLSLEEVMRYFGSSELAEPDYPDYPDATLGFNDQYGSNRIAFILDIGILERANEILEGWGFEDIAAEMEKNGIEIPFISWWWLRSPGRSSNFVAHIDQSGRVDLHGSRVTGAGSIRPALWVSLAD